MEIRYFGWSGITVREGDVLVGFDLFGDAVTWDAIGDAATIILCLTHGHPEHAGSMRELLAAPGARLDGVHLVSSPDVVAHVNKDGLLSDARVHGIADGETITVAGVELTTFIWQHMPLLPPGIWPKVEYAFQLLSHPFDLVQIGLSGLRLPANAPTLGFHVVFADGTRVLNYAEGLHRMTNPDEVATNAARFPAETLLFAVEPDDTADIPRWVDALGPSRAYLYEAHRPWRELFGLPYVDLDDYAVELAERLPDTDFAALTEPGQIVQSESSRER